MARPTPSPCHPRLLALIVACLLLLALLPSSAVAQEAEQAHQPDEQPHEPAAPAAVTHDTAATDSSSAPAASSDSDATNERARRLPSARQSSRRTRIDNQGLSARLAAATESVERKLFECRESCGANDDMHLFCEWHCANAGECGTRALARWKNRASSEVRAQLHDLTARPDLSSFMEQEDLKEASEYVMNCMRKGLVRRTFARDEL